MNERNTTAQRSIVYLALPIAYMLLIFLLSSVPGDISAGDPGVFLVFAWLAPDFQNLLHIPLFGGLAWFWCDALRRVAVPSGFVLLAAFAITVLYGSLDEIHQSFIPGRMANLIDVALNTIGAAVAIVAYRLWGRRRVPGRWF
ncbi:MAG: VanZ family protein [Gammaproteobacteria bacterium]